MTARDDLTERKAGDLLVRINPAIAFRDAG